MVEVIKSIIIGIVQGLTEFLPVSSSGHIVIASEILGTNLEGDENLLFAIILHFATALSTVVVFWKDIVEIFKGLFKFKNNEEFNFSLKIILSMIPAVLVGVLLKDTLEEIFNNLLIVGSMLIITAGLLFFADRAKNTGKDVSYKDALIIGISQGFAALLPGLSRSGSTISTSILLGDDKSKAARFSFLMVLPLIFGAAAKTVLDAKTEMGFDLGGNMSFAALLGGFFAAFIAGVFACKWMIELVKKAKLTYFSVYCLIVGIAVIIYSLYIK